jgi:Reverse transcriptase (RNA-dependent DNA polymerase)/Endonuclease-reverse transcriptase
VNGHRLDHKNISVILWNCEGLTNAVEKIPSPQIFFKNDLLVFCETFLKEDEHIDLPGFYGYHRHAQFLNSRWRRGISCFIKPHLGTFSHVETTDEALIVVLDTMTIMCCYCPPSLTATQLETILFDALQFVPAELNLLVLGDFNARIDPSRPPSAKAKTKVLTRALEALNLTLANEPTDLTYISGNGCSTIDLIFFDEHFMTLKFCEVKENIQNFKHIPVQASFTLRDVPAAAHAIEIKPVYKVDETLFAHNFQSNFLMLHHLLDMNQIDEAYKQILHLIRISEAKKQLSQRTAKPWFNKTCYEHGQEIKIAKDQLNDLERRIAEHKTTGSPIPEDLSDDKSEGLIQIAEMKRSYREACDTARDNFNRKQEEKLIIEAEKAPYLVLRNSKTRITPNISLANWVAHFSTVLNKSNLSCNDSLHLDSMLQNYHSDAPFALISDEEVSLAISKLKSGKAPGPDKMLNDHIKLLEKHKMLSVVTKLFNKCVALNRLPTDWRISNLNLLYKGKGPKTDVNNFRGIALSNVLYKLLDKVILHRLFADLRPMIPATQFGYMPGRRTEQAVQKLHDYVNQQVYVNNAPVYAVFIDYSKAFDSVNRRKLFQKLIDLNVFPTMLLKTVSMLLDVNFLSIFDGVQNSDLFVQSNGTLQGGSSSPIFYIFYTHDLNNFVRSIPAPAVAQVARLSDDVAQIARQPDDEEVRIITYADDTAMFTTSLSKLQAALDRTQDYSDNNDLCINAAKTVAVKFRRGGNIRKTDKIYCKEVEITFQNSVRYLGVTLSHIPRSFAKHTAARTLSANIATFDIKKISRLSVDAAIRLFFIKVAPIASFGLSVVWPHLTITDIRKLNMVYDSYLKRMMCIHKSSKNRIVHHVLNVDSFVGHLQVQFNLPYTGAFGAFLEERERKQNCLPERIQDTLSELPNRWRNPLQDDRHVYTRIIAHGFHFKFCVRVEFHHAEEECRCKFCDLRCDYYHCLSCENSPFLSLADLADHKFT